MTAQEVIRQFEELSPEERKVVTDYLSQIDGQNSPFEEDDDVGLEEDAREAQKDYEEWKRTGEDYSLDDVCKEMGLE